MFDFSSLRKSVTSLAGQVKEVRREIADLQSLRARIEGAPPSREDFMAHLEAHLQQQSARYIETLSNSFEFFRRHPSRLGDPALMGQHLSLFGVARHPKDVDQTRGLDGMLCALIPSVLPELRKRIESMPWPEDARPLEGRDKSIAAIDAKLEALMQQESELTSTAASCGIVIESRGQ